MKTVATYVLLALFGIFLSAHTLVSSETGGKEAKHEKLKGETEADMKETFKVEPGYYKCTGLNADGKPYYYLVTVLRKGEAHVITWVSKTGDVINGCGLIRDNKFVVSWRSGTNMGVAVFVFTGKGVLDGESLQYGDTKVLKESMKFFAPFEKDE